MSAVYLCLASFALGFLAAYIMCVRALKHGLDREEELNERIERLGRGNK